MTIGEYIAIAVFGITIISTSVTIMSKISRDLRDAIEDVNKKRERVYQRIDEEKGKSDNKYVFKDICSLRHEQLDKTLQEVRDDVKTLIRMNGNKGA